MGDGIAPEQEVSEAVEKRKSGERKQAGERRNKKQFIPVCAARSLPILALPRLRRCGDRCDEWAPLLARTPNPF